MTDTTKIDIPAERKQAYDFIDANPSMPQSERLIKFAALARKQERLECAKAACYYCRTERFYETAQRTKPGYWNHVAKTEGDPDVPCRVAPIHERNLAETGA